MRKVGEVLSPTALRRINIIVTDIGLKLTLILVKTTMICISGLNSCIGIVISSTR